MKFGTTLFVLALLSTLSLRAGDYEKAWECIHKNDIPHARIYLANAMRVPATHDNALATWMLLESYEGYMEDLAVKLHNPVATFRKPDPYFYALWFTDAVLGEYKRKSGYELDNLHRMISDSSLDGSLRAAGEYAYSHHLACSNQAGQMAAHFAAMGAIEHWSHVGPFDNISGSGFDKDYGPIHEPHTGKGFISLNNTPIDWFTPAAPQGWVILEMAFPVSAAIGYSQSFVKSEKDTDGFLCLGGAGTFKVWVNDRLLIVEQDENLTELDEYNVPVHLHAGYNRILVQTGFTSRTSVPNFIVRLTDARHHVLPGLTDTSGAQLYLPDTLRTLPAEIPHFAVAYFQAQLQKNPNDITSALLLSKTYIRNRQYDKAKAVLHPFYIKYPQDVVILSQYINCLGESKDKTEMLELIERLKALDPQNYWVLLEESNRLTEESQFPEALDTLLHAERLMGEREVTLEKKVILLSKMQQVDSLIATVRHGYEKMPGSSVALSMMFVLERDVQKNRAAALKLLEDYNENQQSNFDVQKSLVDEYEAQSMEDKAMAVLRNIVCKSPDEKGSYDLLINHFYRLQQYDSALHYLQIQRGLSPYNYDICGSIADCYVQKKEIAKAIEYYQQALAIYPGQYEYRRHLRELQGKPDIFKYFPAIDYVKTIADAYKQPLDSAEPFITLFDQDNVVLYGQGASERINSCAMLLQNKAGIDGWKEVTIPYNEVYQLLNILKAEVVKRSGARIPADVNDNTIVFEKLEPGDAIYYTYKVSNYPIGRLGKEFWDRYYFCSPFPTRREQYNLLVADSMDIQYKVLNDDTFKPVTSQHENFKLYSWTANNLAPIHNQPFMPSLSDIGTVLHVSTIRSWDVIEQWYSDLTRLQSREDYDLNQAFADIFPEGLKGLDDLTKARRIYAYIEAHIAYSSVPFRQSAYVPQRASKTLATRLGDCKDLSTLFLAFARKAGLAANLVLVSTRDNGQRLMELPSVAFNHCIVRVTLGGENYYLELTDNLLPFNVMPSQVYGAQILNIPFQPAAHASLEVVNMKHLQPSFVHMHTTMTVHGNDLEITQRQYCGGIRAEVLRSVYSDKNRDDCKEQLYYTLHNGFKNAVEIDSFDFANLNNLADTVGENVHFKVLNEVLSVGGINMLHPVFRDQVATANIFTGEDRQYPFLYWNYENTDEYSDEVEIHLENGKVFDQVPADMQALYKNMQYSITYRRTATDVLLITRTFHTNSRVEIPVADFAGLKTFFQQIMREEQKYISFK
ncbi:Transglutaminase-like superfamily protein [Chitinophaga costaii]|uniref:Transglutaminase-like superfamily protein n=1 Tax=Chitinophaga costaii TaxID=1335309 RepID=A0A1C4F5E1_9BACT|nr:DUF3857 domain-containing protein [Chitinophaga costaii]SCC50721.1 Transglutaminase-like superfamily protein [Chitinophaga costaii]